MLFAIIIYIILSLLTIYSTVREAIKRRNLGDLIMKVQLDKKSCLIGFLMILLVIPVAYFCFREISKYNIQSGYDIRRLVWILSSNVLIFLGILNGLIRLFKSREIREKGVTLSGWSAHYYDIRGLNWLSDNKIVIHYDPSNLIFFNRQFKEKWVVAEDQVKELKQLFQEKYHDAF